MHKFHDASISSIRHSNNSNDLVGNDAALAALTLQERLGLIRCLGLTGEVLRDTICCSASR